MKLERTMKADVLVIGGGGAGVRAAIEAGRQGSDVLLVSKGPITRSGLTPQAFTSLQASFHPEDSPDIHFKDTVHNGHHLGDQNLIRFLADQAVPRTLELHRWGVPFKMERDKFLLVFHPGQSYTRNLVIQGGGYAMMVRLKQELDRQPKVRKLEDTMVTRLLLSGGEIVGAVGFDQRDGKVISIQAKSIILATGGYERLWGRTDAAPDSTGDGTALALRAGACLVDMELMQFYPTLFFYTEGEQGLVVVYEWFLEERYLAAKLINAKGEEFLPNRPLLRDELSEFIFREVAAGRGTDRGGVFIDVSRSKKTKEEKDAVYQELIAGPGRNLRNHGIDVTTDLIEVAPGTHFALGGVHINERCETTVPGLYAAGEVAANLHGANRVSGNALTETQVFGAQAGKMASIRSSKLQFMDLPAALVQEEAGRIQGLVQRKGEVRPVEIRRRLQGLMDLHMSPVRTEKGMEAALAQIGTLKDALKKLVVIPQTRFNYELIDALQVVNMIDLAEIVVRCAQMRKESRGHHLHEDFPGARKDWQKHTAASWHSGTAVLSTVPVVTL